MHLNKIALVIGSERIDKARLGNITMISIRKAKEADTSQLERLFLIVRQQTFTWENPNKFKIADYKNVTDGETVFVAEEAGEIVGFISVWEHDTHPFIHHLFNYILELFKYVFRGFAAFLFEIRLNFINLFTYVNFLSCIRFDL